MQRRGLQITFYAVVELHKITLMMLLAKVICYNCLLAHNSGTTFKTPIKYTVDLEYISVQNGRSFFMFPLNVIRLNLILYECKEPLLF